MLAHSFLQTEFGVIPKVGWNIFAFGHSATNARLFSDLGYKGQFFAKIDNDIKDNLHATHDFNFLWQPSSNLGS
jgi:lysosomal alpha-mannosidase